MTLLENKQEISMGELINPYFDFIKASTSPFLPLILMLSIDKKGSKLVSWVYFALIICFPLFLGTLAKKLRKSLVLTERTPRGRVPSEEGSLMKYRMFEKKV